MAVLSVPLRGAEVERVPLGFLFQGGQINCARVVGRNCDVIQGEDNC